MTLYILSQLFTHTEKSLERDHKKYFVKIQIFMEHTSVYRRDGPLGNDFCVFVSLHIWKHWFVWHRFPWTCWNRNYIFPKGHAASPDPSAVKSCFVCPHPMGKKKKTSRFTPPAPLLHGPQYIKLKCIIWYIFPHRRDLQIDSRDIEIRTKQGTANHISANHVAILHKSKSYLMYCSNTGYT